MDYGIGLDIRWAILANLTDASGCEQITDVRYLGIYAVAGDARSCWP